MSVSSQTSQIDIREILALLWRRKWLIIIPLPLVAALTFAGSYLITPEYESSTIIQINPQIRLIGDIRRLIDQPTNYSDLRGRDRANMLRSMFNEITSSHYSQLLDERMQLVKQPEIERQARLYVQLQPNMTIEKARLSVLQDQLKEAIRVDWASGDQIRIVVNSTDAARARDMANQLGDIFIAERIRQDLNQIRSSQDFSDVALEKYENQVREILSDITEVEQELARVRNSENTSAPTNRPEIENEISQTETDISDFRQEERVILGRLRGVEGLNVNRLTLEDSETKQSAQSEQQERLRQIGDLLSRYIWSDPQVLRFRERQNELRDNIEAETESLIGQQYSEFDLTVQQDLLALFNIRSRLDYLYTKKPYLVATLSVLDPSIDRIPELEGQLAQLNRELQVATDMRDTFRLQQQSSTISQDLAEGRAKYRKVEPAKLALAPFKPDRKKILLMGIMLGLAIGGAAVLLVELMDNSFKKVEDVEEFLGLPVIGITPKVDFDKRLTR